jgi:Ca-activated chloride channel homolog
MSLLRKRHSVALILVIIFLLSVSSLAEQSDDVIRIETDLVLINATVTDATGRYVSNLRAEDFLLKEDGTKRQIAHFAAEDAPFAAAILIDSSGSMKIKLPRARVAASQFADSLREGDVIAVYGFNTVIEQLQDFTSIRDITPDVWEMEAKGFTSLYDCLYEALEALGKRKEQRRAIILVSDGADTNSRHSAEQVLGLALEIGAAIYSVDIAEANAGKDSSTFLAGGILKGLADKTGGQYIKSVGGKQLNERLLDISKELRSQYTLGFYPEKQANKRRHKLALEVQSRQGVKVRARQEYGS